jgi:[acyl-carrier-protein] S-malonyltransferase
MTVAFTFPGQGSQQVGMGRDIAEAFQPAREVFEEVDEALSQHLSKLIWNGPEDELTLTENAQPALMAVSLAVFRTLQREGGFKLDDKVAFVAGHSLGEYSALAAAGTFTVADTARLLKTRGRAMQRAVPVGQGAMAALLGLDIEQAVEVALAAARGEVCQAANDNAPGQVVVSGHAAAVGRAVELAREHGARRAVLLSVSAPFHCALMQPAADAMARALGEVDMNAPSVPLVANVSASSLVDPGAIAESLVSQVTGLVRWRESVAFMAHSGVHTLYELGAGRVLSGLVRRIDRDLDAVAVGTPAEIEVVGATL